MSLFIRSVRYLLGALIAIIALGTAAAAQCTLKTTDPSVTICTPANGATVASPVHIVAGTTSSRTVTKLEIWVDGKKLFVIKAPTLDTYVTMAAGNHAYAVIGYNTAGQTFKQTNSITATTPAISQTIDGTKIKHIIFMLQENRSLDTYLGRLNAYRTARGLPADFDGIPLNVTLLDNAGNSIQPFHQQTVCADNTTPAWNESHAFYDYMMMDRFMITNARSMPSTNDPNGQRAMGYYDWNDLPYYYALAYNFGTSDRFFSSGMMPTIPNRMYMFAGTSFGHIRPDTPPSGGWTQPNIWEKLTAKGIKWRYYYQDNSVFLADWSDWHTGDNTKVWGISNFYNDIQNPSTLPSVIFIERAGKIGLDEHPMNNIQTGAASVANIINKLMASPSWSSSVFILAYDEGGGLYDHVPPQPMVKPDSIAPMLRSTDAPGDFSTTGYRVPMIVISPWSKPNYVSHVTRDFTSILKMIEVRFGLTP
ncbi:MAG TPA: alkaline phosphatase family protein, partial [Terriglobales bacterium]|nr:alkaline phosphatase family protein [Terriglobales bacterium]